MRGWVGGGLLCEWLSKPDERTFALPVVDNNFTYVSLTLARLHESHETVTLVSRSPEVAYKMPEDGVVETIHGRWPAPFDSLAALARGEVSGVSRGRLLYNAYWHALSHSPALRLWVAEQYPAYWKSLVLSFPAMGAE
jgi:hypothetical protein